MPPNSALPTYICICDRIIRIAPDATFILYPGNITFRNWSLAVAAFNHLPLGSPDGRSNPASIRHKPYRAIWLNGKQIVCQTRLRDIWAESRDPDSM